ncbi:MAG: hypothetical protein J6U23_12555 [Clostridiales bacterium]|nr:hypothetical protein [Clostridiales bacterium]MBP5417611.1 hypothetical protein [Clostridiales bacterium]
MSNKAPSLLKDSCYFCTSTYQLFSILSLAISRKEKADLYIDPQFKDAEIFAQRIELLGIFDSVFIIDSKKIYSKYISRESGLINHLQIARTYFHVNSISKIIDCNNASYKNIFVSSRAFIPRLYILSCYKKKMDVKVYYFDDGVGSYYGNSALNPSKADGMVRKVLFGKKALDFDQDRYLMCPEMYKKINGETPYQVLGIDRFFDHPEYSDYLDKVFVPGKDVGLSESAVILEEISDTFGKKLDDLNALYQYTLEAFGPDDLLMKRHPRSKDEKRKGFRYYQKSELPFEILCIRNDMNKKVLISVGSTALSTPKMITGQEPYVILLYKFIQNEGMNQEPLDHFFMALKESYGNPDKVMMPASFDEYKECVEKILGEIRR